jgi:hypothetical protein
VNGHPRQHWLRQAVEKRLREELAKLRVEVNEDKTRRVDLAVVARNHKSTGPQSSPLTGPH